PEHFHVEAVAFVDEQIQVTSFGEEAVHIFFRQSIGKAGDLQVGVDFHDFPRHGRDLRQAKVVHACAYAIEVGEFEYVEVGNPQLAEDALHGHGEGDGLPHGQADQPDFFCGQRLV